MPQQINRLLIAFLAVLFIFIFLKVILKPQSYGQYGPYRGAAIEEEAEKPITYSGSERCLDCHPKERKRISRGLHKQLKCELCHGPGEKHNTFAAEFEEKTLPDSLKLERHTSREFCGSCHNKNSARIKLKFGENHSVISQVDINEHNVTSKKTGEAFTCIDCHNPHRP